jgi:ArsR family transcriptional regulator, arsenate/arsenite/antimonite-responsive transcriptional repressor
LTSTPVYVNITSMSVDATVLPVVRDEPCCLPRQIKRADRDRAAGVAAAARMLSDPVRVEILDLLRDAGTQVCQCELQPLFDITQPTLSHHLKKLSDAELIDVQRRGKWAYYSINDNALEVLRSWLS